MTILHISSINNKKSNGMNVVIPEYIKNQSKLEKVALYNCNNQIPEKLRDNYKVFLKKKNEKFDLKKLEEPFNKPDIVVFHGIYKYDYISIYKELIKQNIPYIIIPHGGLTKQAQKIKKIKKIVANAILFNKFIKKANYIQFLSKKEKEYSSKFDRKSFILGNGIYVPEKLLKQYNEKKEFKILYIGRYDIYQKGLNVLADAVKLINKDIKNKNITINLYGPINKQERTYKKAMKLKSIIRKYKIGDIVKMNDAAYEKEKEEILLSSDIFIQLSKSEGQPLGIMEAMAYGLPCIVTEGTTFKEIIEKNKCGYTVELDKKNISNQILYIIENHEELSKMSKNAYKYAKENFEWNKILKESIEKYKEIIKEEKECIYTKE